jgi:hypothetical protein
MTSTHCFLFWFVLQTLKPTTVIESGVWQGLGTWLIEEACPKADLYCIDLSWKRLKYRSPRATYLDTDFDSHDWSHLPSDETLLFFDDHVDAYARAHAVHRRGLRHVMFEDNYPHGRGDCYSLKEVFEETGHRAVRSPRSWLSRIRGTLKDTDIAAGREHAAEMRRIAEVYLELPPIFKLPETRWGDAWDDRLPTPSPLLQEVAQPYQQLYLDEAKWYTWMCYLRLKADLSTNAAGGSQGDSDAL